MRYFTIVIVTVDKAVTVDKEVTIVTLVTVMTVYTFVWVQQTVKSSYWSCHRKRISLEPRNKRFNSAYLQNEFVISRIFLSDTFGLFATFTC